MASRCCEESRLIQKLAKSLELFVRESEFNNLQIAIQKLELTHVERRVDSDGYCQQPNS